MISRIRIENYTASECTELFSLTDAKKAKEWECTVHVMGGSYDFKSAFFRCSRYSGKCITEAIETMADVLLDKAESLRNLSEQPSNGVCLGVSFIQDGKNYNYDFRYNSTGVKYDDVMYNNGFVYECLSETFVNQTQQRITENVFLKDYTGTCYFFNGAKDFAKFMKHLPTEKPLIYSTDLTNYPVVENYREILKGFASSLDVVRMDSVVPVEDEIAFENNDSLVGRMESLVRSMDIHVCSTGNPNFCVAECGGAFFASMKSENGTGVITFRRDGESLEMEVRLTGTYKLISLASHVADALKSGKTLVVEDLKGVLSLDLRNCLLALFDEYANNDSQIILVVSDES